MKQTGVGKIRKNINNFKKQCPYKEPLIYYLPPRGWGCLRILGGIAQFSVVTERGSEYNIVEWENSRKLTAIEGGG